MSGESDGNTKVNVWDTPEVRAHHAHVLDAHLRVSEAYPKTIMLLSGGALALSLNFLEKSVNPNCTPPNGPWFLRLGWASLVLSLLTISCGMLLSLGLLERATHNYAALLAGTYRLSDCKVCLTKLMNGAAAMFLVAGLALLALFASVNVR